MFRYILTAAVLLSTTMINAQFKNDNVLYTTVDPADLCAKLKQNKGYLLLDVRSKGEYADSSSFAGYNFGHLRGAINIDVRELGTRLSEISEYRNRPVFLYCSHSQRSRRAGKMLADSGFTKVFNVNGGLTSLYYHSLYNVPCLKDLLESSNPYAIISAKDLCRKMNNTLKPFLLDVRPDSAFRHISLDAKENAYGAFAGTINIPLADLEKRMAEVPHDREIIITDIYGDESAKAAQLLTQKGYTQVSVLIEGIDRLIQTDEKEVACKTSLYRSPAAYPILSTIEFARQYQHDKKIVLLDIRSREEYTNNHKESWRNIGHLVNAVNMPADELRTASSIPGVDKQSTIVVYAFGNSPEIYAVADGLYKDGYTHVMALAGGIFNIRWSAGNVTGYAWLKDIVKDVPEKNQ